MNEFDNIIARIKKNKNNHSQGNFNCIPFSEYERLEKIIPGVEHSSYYLITASSGVGKSKLCRNFFVNLPYSYCRKNNIPIKIFYFSLEESKEKVILSEISKYLFLKYNIIISVKQLRSVGRYNTVSEDIISLIEEAKDYVNKYLEVVDIIDDIRNPTGIYKHVRDYALKIGTYYNYDNTPFTPNQMLKLQLNDEQEFKNVAYYKKHDENHYVIVIIDHISLLTTESGLTDWQTMGLLSNKYLIKLRNTFGFTPVVVQQQVSDKERIEVNFRGETVIQKLRPSLDGLGDNKTIQRDVDIAIGLFSPERYGIADYNGYRLNLLKDNYRELLVLKDRDGISNRGLSLYFRGECDYFEELPYPEETEKINNYYNLQKS